MKNLPDQKDKLVQKYMKHKYTTLYTTVKSMQGKTYCQNTTPDEIS